MRHWYLFRVYEFVLAPCQLAWLEPKIDKLRRRLISSPPLSSSACRQRRQAEEERGRWGALLASSPVSFTSQTSWLGSTHTVDLHNSRLKLEKPRSGEGV